MFIEDYYKVSADLRNFISNLIFDYDIPLEIDDELEISNILKAFGLKLKLEDNLFIERIVNFLKIYLEVFKLDVFIFVNLTQFLSEDELDCLVDFLSRNQILLINYDRIYMNSKVLKNQILFDNDLCRIL